MIRSPFFYVGDKAQLIDQILAELPTNINNYYEPFVGGGTVAMNVQAKKYYLSDINDKVIELHSHLLKGEKLADYYTNLALDKGFITQFNREKIPLALKKEFPKTYNAHYNKQTYLKIRKEYNETQNNDLLYLLIIYGFNRIIRFNKKGQFNLPVGNLILNEKVCNALNSYEEFAKNDVEISCKSFEELFKVDFKENDFVYIDPPYLISNAEYNKIWTEDNEQKLYEFADFLNSRGVKFMISNICQYNGVENTYLNKFREKYKSINVTSNYISFNNNKQKKITELLIKNY